MTEDVEPTGFGLIKPNSGYDLIGICRTAAKEYPESYTVGDWIPHKWVIRAMRRVAMKAYGDGRIDEARTWTPGG